MKRKCNFCQKEYEADQRNLKRGWGLCCSKSCAASVRERAKPGYDPVQVQINNIRRANWTSNAFDKSLGDKSFVDEKGRYGGRTSEGYRIYGDTAYDEYGQPIYKVDPYNNSHPFSEDAFN